MPGLNSQLSALLPQEKKPIPADITANLNPRLEIRPYQSEAFSRFTCYMESEKFKKKPVHLLFHMATGSGKTLVMAGLILDLYSRGYRNFIFLVNSTHIIEKTKDNFLNAASGKYLFSRQIRIGHKRVGIREVNNFETANQEDIHILFTTVQGLHARLNTPRENAVTPEDFAEKKVALLSDEAHHINADTKRGNTPADTLSWEGTVQKILGSNPENILLEFTATAGLDHENIREKYRDKLLFDYPLKQFWLDKFSKEVKIHQAGISPFFRAVKAIILSQYRRKIFGDYYHNVKPVVLFKSKTIKESEEFFAEFSSGIKSLQPEDLETILSGNSDPVFAKIFNYLQTCKISPENLIAELQEDFGEEKCLVVNSKNDSEENQLILNTLENENNAYRAIFAVDKLNEGWDVLNLFDIVRLYDTRGTGHRSGKIQETTLSEAQLIGRGARYFPFRQDESQPLFQRKYDEAVDHPLRICEELYYHASHNPKYISELNKALEKIGIKAPNQEKEPKKINPIPSKKTPGKLQNTGLPKTLRDQIFQFFFETGSSSTAVIFQETAENPSGRGSSVHPISAFGGPVIRKAAHQLPFYRFDHLQKHFPALRSVSEFIQSPRFLGNIRVEIQGDAQLAAHPTPQMKLASVIKVLEEIAAYYSV